MADREHIVDEQTPVTPLTTLPAVPWAPQGTRYIPFNIALPDGKVERVLVDAPQVWAALMTHLPHWADPAVKHSFIEAEFRTTIKAGVKLARALMLDGLFAQLPAGYPKPPNKVAKGEDYLISFGLYLFRLFVDVQAATGGPVATIERADGVYRVADVTMPTNVTPAATPAGAGEGESAHAVADQGSPNPAA